MPFAPSRLHEGAIQGGGVADGDAAPRACAVPCVRKHRHVVGASGSVHGHPRYPHVAMPLTAQAANDQHFEVQLGRHPHVKAQVQLLQVRGEWACSCTARDCAHHGRLDLGCRGEPNIASTARDHQSPSLLDCGTWHKACQAKRWRASQTTRVSGHVRR